MLSSLKVVETYFIGTFSEATDYINSFHKSDSNSGWLREKHELYLCAVPSPQDEIKIDGSVNCFWNMWHRPMTDVHNAGHRLVVDIMFFIKLAFSAVVVAQLAEQLLPTPEICGLHPKIGKKIKTIAQ